MAKPFFTLSLSSLCIVLLASSCIAISSERFNECQLESLNALEPDHRVECDGGLIETWNSQHPELKCAGVTVSRRTLHRNALHLPSYSPYPQLILIVQGQGALGLSLPGCPQTYEEPSEQYRRRGRQQQQPEDRHQKIRQFTQGDVLLIPPGVPYWTYNTADEPLVAVSLLDISSSRNQLDQSPRVFYLAGNPDLEHPETKQQQPQPRSAGGRKHGQHQLQEDKNKSSSVLSALDKQFTAQVFGIDEDIAKKIQSPDDETKQIIRVEGGLSVISPKWQDEDEDEDEEQDQPRRHPSRRPSHERREDDDEDEDEDKERDQPRPHSRRPSHGRREDEDEDEEERRPRPSRRPSHGRQEDEDEDEEEERDQPRPHSRQPSHGRREDEDEDEEKPRPRPSRRPSHGRQEDEDEDEEEERDQPRPHSRRPSHGRREDEDEDEEKPRPRPSRRPSHGRQEDEDEDEEEERDQPRHHSRRPSHGRREDEDEDEEEPRPRPSRRPSHGRQEDEDEDEEEEWDQPRPHRSLRPSHGRREDEDEDEDQPRPRPSRRPSHGRREDEDEDEDEEQPRSHPSRRPSHGRREDEDEDEDQPRHHPSRRPSHGRREDEDEDEDEEQPRSHPSRRPSHGRREDEDEDEDQPRHHPSRRPSHGRREDEDEDEFCRPIRRPSHGGQGNGIEENICSLKLQENIVRPSRANFYNPRAGRISNVNSLTLPALRQLDLSAQYVVLYKNGIYAPHWNLNANSLIYVTRGQGRVRVVNCQGNSVFNGELRRGQLLVVPQNFVVAEQAGEQGFEYIVFKTNHNAITSYMKDVFRAMPSEVLANAFNLRQSQAHDLKYNGNWGPLVNPDSHQRNHIAGVV